MFEQIVIVEETGLQDWAIAALQKHSVQPITLYNDIPRSKRELNARIENADCAFISWNVQIDAEVLSHCKKLKYIGMCCSLYSSESANVDIDNAAKNGITVTGIRDYGDEGLVEYIVSALIQLIKGFGDHQWQDEPVELTRRKVGIIGMGTTGQMLASRLQAFGADLYYYNRSKKPDAENNGVSYLPLADLLSTCEIISLHLPKNTSILKQEEFAQLGNGKVLINTSLGLTFDKAAFESWISNEDNYVIFDGDGIGAYREEFARFKNVISTPLVSGWTKEAKERLSQKVLSNLEVFLNQ